MSEDRKAYKAPAYGYTPVYGHESDEIDLARLWTLLMENRWLLIGVTGAALLLGLIYVSLATPIYKADALLQVEKEQKTLPGLSEMAELFSQTSSAQTEIELLRSRMVLGEAVQRLNLDVQIQPESGLLDIFTNTAFTPGFGKQPGFAQWHGDEQHVAIADLQLPDALKGRTLTLEAGDAGTYSLSHEGEVLLSGQVGEQVSQGDISLSVSRLQAGPGARFELMQRPQLDVTQSLNDRLSVSEKGKDTGILALSLTHPSPPRAEAILNTIASVYQDQNLERRSAEAEKSLDFLEQQLPEIKSDLTAAEETLNEYRSQRDSVDLTLETESKLTRLVELETRLNELSIKENELQQRYTREHPAYRTLIEQRRSLEREKQKLEKEIEGLPETQQQVLRLRRDMDVNQQIYMQLRNKAQELRVLKAGTVANVRIIDKALTSPDPVKPRKRLVLALSLVLGAMLAVAYVLVRQFFNRTVRSPEELEEVDLNVYASVPVSERQIALDRSSGSRKSLALLAREAPTDLAVEALRSLRTSLHFAMLDATSNVLMLSGPAPGAGKSFISANLGVVLAQTDQSVVLVDADLRKGHLHRYFNADSGPGLSDYLAGKAELEEVIRESGVPGLRFIPRGEVPPNPAELLMRQRMKTLTDALAADNDRVIIDTPPILAVTDPAIVGQYAGASLLVVRYGVNHIKEVEVAYKRFRQNGIEIKGAILNAMEHSRSNVYGYYPYRYGGNVDKDEGQSSD